MSRTLRLLTPHRAAIALLALVGAAALAAPAHANDMGPRLRGSPFLGSDVLRSRDIQNREEWYSRTHPLHVKPVIPNGYYDMENWYSQTHPLHVKPVTPPGYYDMERWYSRTHP
jgi:hypothetical protein